MGNILGSFFRALTTTFDTTTQGLLALNHLARGAAERTVVIEEKSINAAAKSRLRNKYDVARELQDIYNANTDLSDEVIAEGEAFLNAYREERKLAAQPVVITKVSKTTRKKATTKK